MEGTSALIESIATILWPAIVIIILLSFRKNIQALIESSETRKFTFKVGEMELNMDEFSKQQGDMIKDLQTRMNELQRQMEIIHKIPAKDKAPTEELEFENRREEIRRAEDVLFTESKPNAKSVTIDIDDGISDILWVDDNPRNNAFLIASLNKEGISVSTAKHTKEAIKRFERGAFDCVISDSTRLEGNEIQNHQAGFELAGALREIDKNVPIYIYTDEVNEKMKEKAHNVGATAITSSPSELLKLLSD